MKASARHGRSGSETGPYLKTTIDPNKTFTGRNNLGIKTERNNGPSIRKNRFYNTIEGGGDEYSSIREIVEKYADPIKREE